MAAPIIIYPSRGRLIISVLAGFALTALFAAIIIFRDSWNGLDSKVIATAYVGTPIAILATAYWIYRLVLRRPLIVISTEGIIDHSSLVGAGLIPWSNISQIGFRERKGDAGTSKLLTITPRDIKALQKGQNMLTRLNEMADNDIVEIGTVGLPMKIDALYSTIQTYYQANVHASLASPVTFAETPVTAG